ncbi:MAG: hypothetical protein CVV34_02825, partial [Methanomicrobiales archaeon HGW-Methanomicrobiales-5]
MDTGKIFLGIALIAFSVTMVINPASAAVGDYSCPVGGGNHFDDGCQNATGVSPDPDDTISSDSPLPYGIP